MGLVGVEIIQSRTWLDPHAPPAPNLNHKNVFPITVFDAVRESMTDESSKTLTQVIEQLDTDISNKQPVLPNLPSNHIVTYGGSKGAVGSIPITDRIDPDNATRVVIPTEKAIGVFVRNEISKAVQISWTDIIGTPVILSRPPIDASDDKGNGNMIVDAQWVVDKVNGLISDHDEVFMEKLKTILPCLSMPKPDPPEDITVYGVTNDNIEDIVNGTAEPIEPTPNINIDGHVLSRIPDAVIEQLVEGNAKPEPSNRIVVDNIWIEAIDTDMIDGLIDGTITPTTSSLVIPKEIIKTSMCNCPCCLATPL